MKFEINSDASEEHFDFMMDDKQVGYASYDAIGSAGIRAMKEMFAVIAEHFGSEVQFGVKND